MQTKSIGLVWITVKDLNQAVKFYTEVVGLKLLEHSEEWKWAELGGYGEEGGRLGIAQANQNGKDPVEPGQNAAMTFTVDSLDDAIDHLKKQGALLEGEVEEIPGHVKMQGLRDLAGNFIQMIELISPKS